MGISRAINLRERVHLSSRDGFLCVPEGRELNWTVDQFVENFSDHGVSVNDTQVRGIGRRLHVGNAYEVTIWDVDCRIGMSEVMRCINHHRLIAGSYQGQFLVRELCESVLPAGICFFPGFIQDLWRKDGVYMVPAYDSVEGRHILLPYEECRMYGHYFAAFHLMARAA